MPLKYDPKLRKAMYQIKKILDQYDIAGLIVLHSEKQKSEFLLKINPSYSCATFSNNGDYIKIKNTQHKSEKKKKKMLEDTINMIDLISICGANQIMGLKGVIDELETMYNIVHGKGTFTDRRKLDN